MFGKHYVSLSQDEDAAEKGPFQHTIRQTSWQTGAVLLLSLSLLTSLALNVHSYIRLHHVSRPDRFETKFAGLSYDVPKTIEYHSRFNNPNRTEEDAAWNSELVDQTTLVVALDDSFTESRGVLHSMRWPWDSKKGVYTLNSAHELHCLHLLRTTVNQAYDGESPKWPRKHSAHCLEYILQSIMCNADDTPLYQGLLHRNRHVDHPLGGLGDTRQCRDWTKLQTWAKEHSACYDPLHRENDTDLPEIERYKFCPDGSKPWEKQLSSG
ncbi:hypothetical protein M409DRAFT_16318 [Zasmidium cellare ATCC 36951]|uniref:Uncharacterized protein n=1 Tax=Zasmidium cellare ATCC 36951 TaxID=1080233 RepID=A0A6A6D731_ZASCE|nr:uncharacterized protein M409DRAFT_16318 [Zasmidium cellare ATCC 36951]KAF2174042.1 hypothetical protein M409DRAFT_16318 [Zasmidium cellare ATCC 36951]